MTAGATALDTVDAVTTHVPVELNGRRVLVRLTVNDTEFERRAAVGLGAVTDHGLLQVLAGLPADEWFAWSMLDRREQRVLRGAPAGVIDRDGYCARRLLRSAARVEEVLVTARNARAGLRAASQFAPYAQCVVRLPVAVADEVTLLDAALYGIGVIVGHGPDAAQVVAAAPFVVQRWSWAHWLFSERVVEQLLIPAQN
ncbi:MAG: hypothetical protein ACR2LX_01565 [Jatrophihabitans sp.]